MNVKYFFSKLKDRLASEGDHQLSIQSCKLCSLPSFHYHFNASAWLSPHKTTTTTITTTTAIATTTTTTTITTAAAAADKVIQIWGCCGYRTDQDIRARQNLLPSHQHA